jgi:hypothetical protein
MVSIPTQYLIFRCSSNCTSSLHRGSEGLPRTTKSNLHDRLQSVPMTSLSQTIRDAISIVRFLGFRYLWIDALCIVQDSEEDWLNEASSMSAVFGGAILTIAVAASENHSEGIFRNKEARCMRPFRIERFEAVPYSQRSKYGGEGSAYMFPSSEKARGGCRPKGILDSRGWILQQQLLSPRILYYGHGELYWDCITFSVSTSLATATKRLCGSHTNNCARPPSPHHFLLHCWRETTLMRHGLSSC